MVPWLGCLLRLAGKSAKRDTLRVSSCPSVHLILIVPRRPSSFAVPRAQHRVKFIIQITQENRKFRPPDFTPLSGRVDCIDSCIYMRCCNVFFRLIRWRARISTTIRLHLFHLGGEFGNAFAFCLCTMHAVLKSYAEPVDIEKKLEQNRDQPQPFLLAASLAHAVHVVTLNPSLDIEKHLSNIQSAIFRVC